MTEEERKEQTKQFYSMKMWEEKEFKIDSGFLDKDPICYHVLFVRVPSGWMGNYTYQGEVKNIFIHSKNDTAPKTVQI